MEDVWRVERNHTQETAKVGKGTGYRTEKEHARHGTRTVIDAALGDI